MNIHGAFPSTYLRHADLQGRRIVVTIERITIETMGDGENKDTKPVVYFVGAKKAMAFNKTNALEVAMAYGDETDNWVGKQIEVFPSMTQYKGVPTPCIRVRPVYPAGPTGVTASPPAAPPLAAMAHPMQAPLHGAGPGERAAGGADPFWDDLGDEAPF